MLNGVAGTPDLTLKECEDACSTTDGCYSFAHCPRDDNRCWMSNKRFTGGEPTVWKYYCSTYYKQIEGILYVLRNAIHELNLVLIFFKLLHL